MSDIRNPYSDERARKYYEAASRLVENALREGDSAMLVDVKTLMDMVTRVCQGYPCDDPAVYYVNNLKIKDVLNE